MCRLAGAPASPAWWPACRSRWTPRAPCAVVGGVSPIEYSAGRRSSRRLNRGGDGQANAALHRIVFTRLRFDPRTQAYYERRAQEGKTRREVIRCLERNAAREVSTWSGRYRASPRYRGVRDT
ncbi:transposase [Streptomyces coeruleorubidus]|uniref:transposase n=1 Tax=Streptomyces coeruleorubidus TaxID=116188 RepID=UPI00378CB96B